MSIAIKTLSSLVSTKRRQENGDFAFSFYVILHCLICLISSYFFLLCYERHMQHKTYIEAFEMSRSVSFSMFAALCCLSHYSLTEHFHHPKRKPLNHNSLPFPQTTVTSILPAVSEFTYPRCCLQLKLCGVCSFMSGVALLAQCLPGLFTLWQDLQGFGNWGKACMPKFVSLTITRPCSALSMRASSVEHLPLPSRNSVPIKEQLLSCHPLPNVFYFSCVCEFNYTR